MWFYAGARWSCCNFSARGSVSSCSRYTITPWLHPWSLNQIPSQFSPYGYSGLKFWRAFVCSVQQADKELSKDGVAPSRIRILYQAIAATMHFFFQAANMSRKNHSHLIITCNKSYVANHSSVPGYDRMSCWKSNFSPGKRIKHQSCGIASSALH